MGHAAKEPLVVAGWPPEGSGRGPGGCIVVLGELLVEIMREAPGVPLGASGEVFRGPFASGAPAIVAAAAGRLGAWVRFAGVRGDDPFGEMCLRTLRSCGVDTRWVAVSDELPTGAAFVAYEHDGSRAFVFHVRGAAASALGPADVDAGLLDGAAWLHVSGSSLGVSASVRTAVLRAVAEVRAAGGCVAFDPNLRVELMSPEVLAACHSILDQADVVFPSGDELALLTGIDEPIGACRSLLRRGASTVVWKRGARGSTVVTSDGHSDVATPRVRAVDPTGAGDCFAAAFAVARLGRASPTVAARFANAAAALSTTALGPMEALPDRAEVEALVRTL